MFAKPNSSCSTAKAGKEAPPPPKSNNNKKGGNNNKKGKNTPPANATNAASIDTPLRKSDIRNLKQEAKDFFGGDEQRQQTLTTILDQVFQPNQIATRQLHHAELGKLTLYVRTPSTSTSAGPIKKDSNDNDKDDSSSFAWPYAIPQVIWIRQPPMPNTNQVEVVVPTVALLSVLPPETMSTVYLPSAASKFLCRGAHLMRAGMLNLPTSATNTAQSTTSLLRQAPPPRPVALAVYGNPQPMAVGVIHEGVQSAADIGPGTKGVGALVWTCYGDDLWQQQLTQLEQLPSAEVPVRVSPLGGANFNEGHYGNVGFVEGQGVLRIVKSANDESGDEEEEDQEEENTTPSSAWDANEPVSADNDGETKETPNEASNVTPDNDTDTATNDVNNQEEESPQPTPDNEEEEEEEEGISQEDLLHESVCKALLTSLSPKDLPMTVANFYANHVLPNRPPGTTIQLKQTRYKKFGNYLQEQVENKLVTLGPGPKDTKKPKQQDKAGYLIGFDKRHPDLLEYKQDHAEEVQDAKENAQAAAADKQAKQVLVNLHVVPHHFVALLRLDPDAVKAAHASSAERAGTGMLTLPEARNLLESYLTRENLIDYDEVRLDGPLFDALYKKKKNNNADGDGVTNDTLTVSRKELSEQWIAAMQPAYAIVQMPGNKVQKLGRGVPIKVQVEVSMRQSKKFITKIRGMEAYGVNGTVLSKDIGRRLATQATVETQSEKGAALAKGCVEIVLGGNFADEVEALLLGDEKLCPSHGGIKNSDYRLPKGCVDVVLRKGVPARKKRGVGKKK